MDPSRAIWKRNDPQGSPLANQPTVPGMLEDGKIWLLGRSRNLDKRDRWGAIHRIEKGQKQHPPKLLSPKLTMRTSPFQNLLGPAPKVQLDHGKLHLCNSSQDFPFIWLILIKIFGNHGFLCFSPLSMGQRSYLRFIFCFYFVICAIGLC